LDEWRRDFDRWGDWDEWAMVETMWPGGVQPQTAPVEFIPWSEGYDAQAPKGEGELVGPVALQLQSGTFGASIAYSFDEGEKPRWQLYRTPLRLPIGNVHIRAKAVRIGFKDSAETIASYDVK
jgi:N-sulfoglucosamine sulfohydrolase